MRRHHILLPVVALIAVFPLLTSGCSCGHDFGFHMQSWMEAARQFRHGTLLPHWAFSPAYNAGEPRFIFYPPLSWIFGALLTFIAPANFLPALYTFCILAAAGFSMHRLAREFAPENAALIAAALYMVNPYMLFTAYERTAYAELMAAVWMPLLLLAVLRERPTARGIALPVALLWLTNAPAAVMGCYTLALLTAIRLCFSGCHSRTESAVALPPRTLAITAISGAALGLALPAFYLLPAAYERRFVQISMAVIPNMRVEDNFLFGHTGDIPHDTVLHQASLVAVILLAITLTPTLWLLLRNRSAPRFLAVSLTTLAVLTLFLLTKPSIFFWHHIPQLAFLQFPWRLLSVVAVVFALALALLIPPTTDKLATPAIALAAILITAFGIHTFRQGCDIADFPIAHQVYLHIGQGVAPTDEYTPTLADNDALRADSPPYWLAATPDAYAPGTTPTVINPPDDAPLPRTGLPLITSAPSEFSVHAASAGFLILNLRDFPHWDISVDDPNSMNRLHPSHIQREDGLLALRLDNGGDYRIHIAWHQSPDETLGLITTLLAAAIFAWLLWNDRARTTIARVE